MNIAIRRATLDDAKDLFDWRNDAETVARSTGKEVEWADHVRWITAVLKRRDRILCIALLDGEPVGTVRADIAGDEAEISFTVARPARGQGIAKAMTALFIKEYLAGKRIVADIPKGHGASEAVAISLGLKPTLEKASRNPGNPQPVVEWR